MRLLAALAAELDAALAGRKVAGVSSPSSGELLILLGKGAGADRLLLSADPGRAGIYLVPAGVRPGAGLPGIDSLLAVTAEARLAEATLLGIGLPIPGDRVVEISFSAPWPRRGKGSRLVLEAMGRNSNLLLLDAGGRILASHRPLSPAANPVRPLRPGGPYLPPPPAFAKASAGISPPVAETASPAEAAWAWRAGRARSAASPARPAGDADGGMDDTRLAAGLGRLRGARERALRHLREEEERCRDHDRVRLEGETILLHLSKIPRGAGRVRLPHPCDPGTVLEILLDRTLSPQKNAERRFNLARRLARGLDAAAARRDEARASLFRVELASTALASGDPAPARALLGADGGPSSRIARGAGPAEPAGGGLRRGKDGFAILVGRGAADNERVTFGAAGPRDLWLHTRDYPSSHVVILAGGRAVPEAVVRYAAALCAGRSGARKDTAAAVMVAERKWVRKAKGAKPGTVTVARSRTVLARRGKDEDWPG